MPPTLRKLSKRSWRRFTTTDQIVATITRTTWNGAEAVVHRTDEIAVVVLPGRGGKIASLRAFGHEWLAQPELPLGPLPAPGDVFVEGDMCGWDECAPSVVACTLAGWPDASTETQMPDHGELWTVPWTVDPANNGRSVAEGPNSRCVFARAITLGPGPAVRLDYAVTASDVDTPYLWAAHPQLRAPAGSQVLLDREPSRVVDVDSGSDARSEKWRREFAHIDTVAPGGSRKFYLEPTDRARSARLVLPDGRTLTMRWDPVLLPYLGIWFDRSRYSREDVVAIEPSTGWYDSAARALAERRVLQIPAGGTAAWWLELELSPPRSVDGAGPRVGR